MTAAIKERTHKELVEKLREELGNSFSEIKEIKKGSSSGTNYLSIKFETEAQRDIVSKIIPKSSYCEKRYGIGLIFRY